MDYVKFGTLVKRASVLGFGCAPMGSRYGKRECLNALAAAYDRGVNYFDVARSYGYGDAEAILGAFIGDKRERVIVATKFGIEPPTTSPARRLLKVLARHAFRIAPRLRQTARRRLATQFVHAPVTANTMVRSVENSLRQLRTDHVDVLLVHDCSRECVENDELFESLERIVKEGKAICVGVSGDRAILEEAIVRRPILTVAQFRHDLFRPDVGPILRSSNHLASVGYHLFAGGSGIERIRDAVRRAQGDPQAPEALLQKLRDIGESDALAALALSGTRMHGGLNVVLAAMFTRQHIDANARAAARATFTNADVTYLRAVAAMTRAHDTTGK